MVRTFEGVGADFFDGVLFAATSGVAVVVSFFDEGDIFFVTAGDLGLGTGNDPCALGAAGGVTEARPLAFEGVVFFSTPRPVLIRENAMSWW